MTMTCNDCHGTGHVAGPSAGMSFGRPCPACDGTGSERRRECPHGSPVDAFAIIEHAEEMYGDNIPEVIVPEDGPIICCDRDDVAELQSALDAVWNVWIAKHGTQAVFVADDESENV